MNFTEEQLKTIEKRVNKTEYECETDVEKEEMTFKKGATKIVFDLASDIWEQINLNLVALAVSRASKIIGAGGRPKKEDS